TSQYSFNPCFIGFCSSTRHIIPLSIGVFKVSILVLLDFALQQQFFFKIAIFKGLTQFFVTLIFHLFAIKKPKIPSFLYVFTSLNA
ncbi:MAG TPA: hypothetical protein PK354_06695, partial [bacterium]|nr:hypothetical protein [bacterium]